MNDIIIRLLNLQIKKMKNVTNGKISFLNSKFKNNLKLKTGDILGIYGQNGSGKTTVIDSLEILKSILSGISLEKELVNLITFNEKSIELYFEFYVKFEDEYIVEYKIELSKTENNDIEISNESIYCSKYINEQWERKKELVTISYDDNFITPKKNFKNLLIQDEMIEFLVNKGISKKSKISLLFSDDNRKYFTENKDLLNIIKALEYYGKVNLFVVTNEEIGLITLNVLLPLKVKRLNSSGNLPIRIDNNENIIINEEIYKDVEETISEINIVLKRIIPDLQIDLSKLRRDITEKETNIIADLHSIRNGNPISFRYESEGIKRIVSILEVLIAVYHQPSVCLAIDELDSGIFEYLLGEILEVLSDEIKGQLIFTSHNLRILEKINKDNIIFTTVNPDNRYIKFKSVKPKNNLRDMYLREMIVQEQDEVLYEETKISDIKRAFYRAGVVNGKK